MPVFCNLGRGQRKYRRPASSGQPVHGPVQSRGYWNTTAESPVGLNAKGKGGHADRPDGNRRGKEGTPPAINGIIALTIKQNGQTASGFNSTVPAPQR